MKHRAVGATVLNEQSSRSHMVFMLSIAGRHAASGQTVSGACASFCSTTPAADHFMRSVKKRGLTWVARKERFP